MNKRSVMNGLSEWTAYSLTHLDMCLVDLVEETNLSQRATQFTVRLIINAARCFKNTVIRDMICVIFSTNSSVSSTKSTKHMSKFKFSI